MRPIPDLIDASDVRRTEVINNEQRERILTTYQVVSSGIYDGRRSILACDKNSIILLLHILVTNDGLQQCLRIHSGIEIIRMIDIVAGEILVFLPRENRLGH